MESELAENRLTTSLDSYVAFNRRMINFHSDVIFERTPLGPRLNLEKSRIGFGDFGDDQNVIGAHFSAKALPVDWSELFLRASY